MDAFIVIIVLLLVGLVFWGFRDEEERDQAIHAAVAGLADFKPDHVWYSRLLDHAMAIDSGRRKLALVHRVQAGLRSRVIDAERIISAEVLEDGNSITKTVRMGQLGGAAVGGLIFGPLGAVVGGLSSGKRQINQASSIDLDIIVEDVDMPRFTARFLSDGLRKMSVDRGGLVYRATIGEAREWAARIEALIRLGQHGSAP